MSRDSGHKILTGDFNTRSTNDDYKLLVSKGGVIDTFDDSINTFSSTTPKIRIDYIFTSPSISVLKNYAIESEASDHLPVVAELSIDG